MPSTNVNVGLLEGRNSSRVLKPPGGGHSDIFGREPAAPERYGRFKNTCQVSAIQECLYSSDSNTNSANGTGTGVNGDAEAIAAAGSNGQDKEVVDTAAEEAEGVKKEAAAPVPAVVPAPQKVRVPPGGFSNGFW